MAPCKPVAGYSGACRGAPSPRRRGEGRGEGLTGMALQVSTDISDESILPGEAYLADTPVLRVHAGIQPVLFARFILSGHSGGGMPAIDAIAGAGRPPDEVFIFDGLYGRDPSAGDPMRGLEVIDGWLGQRFASEPDRPGALRVIYIERQTGPFSRAVAALIARHLASTEPGVAADLARRYRVEPSGVPP